MQVEKAFSSQRVLDIVEDFHDKEGPLMPILHAVQASFGFVPAEAIPLIAKGLNLSRAEVHGVVSFYHDFRRTPAGRHVVRVCQAESCQAMGGEALTAHIAKRLGTGLDSTSRDAAFTLEPVYCLGNCALSPSLTIDDAVHGRMTPARFDAAIAELERAR